MNHVLIIESDGERARRLTFLCRQMGLSTRLFTDALDGLLQAAHDVPAVILLDAADARLGTTSIAQEFRQHDRLCSIPFIVVGDERPSPKARRPSLKWVEAVIGSFESPDFGDQLTKALERWCVLEKDAVPVAHTPTVGELFCEGNLFRRRDPAGELYELSITEGALWLLPVTRDCGCVRFDDPMALIRRFDFVPWA